MQLVWLLLPPRPVLSELWDNGLEVQGPSGHGSELVLSKCCSADAVGLLSE